MASHRRSKEEALVDRLAGWLPHWSRRYAISLAAFVACLFLYWLEQHAQISPRSLGGRLFSGVFLLIYLLVIAGSAWLGYGPGIMICAISTALLSVLFRRRSGAIPIDFIRTSLFLVVSLLISRLAQSQRRREAELVRDAAELEQRVQERTAETVLSAKLAQKALEDAREQAQLLDLAHDGIFSADWNGAIRFWSRGAEEMYGYSRAEALGKNCHELLRTSTKEPIEQIKAQLEEHGRWGGELIHVRRDGTPLTMASRWDVRLDADGKPAGFLEINTDITEKRKLEEQLRHTQKLESLGVLAGGVAHDFNNLLTGILGNAGLALDSAGPAHPARDLIEEIIKASERAADLTRQLLAYAGKGRFVPRTIDLSELVRDISSLLQTSFPKQVQFRMQLGGALPGIDADPGQVQQIIMNLVLNGAEAIGPEGGSVLVMTGTQDVDEEYIRGMAGASDPLEPGKYVMLEVHDTGSGMSSATLSKIFDPFFTTKFAGRGLGLSAVLGIVRAHKGALRVYSKPGQGSTFKVLFPASHSRPLPVVTAPPRDLRGTGTVMVVDDEDLVRNIARSTLERYGYRAMLASDGMEAIEMFREHPGQVALVLLDLTMPVLSGEETLRRLRAIDPSVRILLTSGYNEVETIEKFSAEGLAGFIQKPFSAAALAAKVKEALD